MSLPLDQHLYLTGFRGTGKTSVGQILAKSLEMPVVDLDDQVEQLAGKTIREIFDEEGETAFRDFETKCLMLVSAGPPTIVALGGGAILRKENRDVITATGLCIWLSADARTLVERMESDETTAQRRPALTSLPKYEEVQKLLTDREPLYRESANHCVATAGKSIEQVADGVLSLIRPPIAGS